MMPLTTANLLPHVIVGSAFEQMDMERLVKEVGEAVAQRVHGMNESVDDIAVELHERLLLRNEETKHLVVEDIYVRATGLHTFSAVWLISVEQRDSEEGRQNVQVWLNAENCAAAQPHIKRVCSIASHQEGELELTLPSSQIIGSRFTDKYLQSRYSRSSYARVHPIPLPSRSSPLRGASPSSYGTSPSTPPRRDITTTFAPFTGSPTFGAKPTFGGFSPSSGGVAPDPNVTPPGSPTRDSASEGQKVDLRSGSISLEQARRIATSAAWRTMRA
jgi:hypothetical protein